MLQAVTSQQASTNVLHEMIAGYVLPGLPVANIIFKTIGTVTCTQALIFAGDLKIGHYMKIPPRVIFSVQFFATVVSSILSTLVQDWMSDNIVDICSRTQPQGFVCLNSNVFVTSSIIWGAIGPRRLFSPGAPYSALLWFFLIGLFAPIPFYLLARRFPFSFYRYVNVPVILLSLGVVPFSSNYMSWVLCGFISNFVIRRLRFDWWMRYNYVTSAALDSGFALAVLAIFFAFQTKPGGLVFDWWGNSWVHVNCFTGRVLICC